MSIEQQITEKATELLSLVSDATDPDGPLEDDTWAIMLAQAIAASLDQPDARDDFRAWKDEGWL